MTAAGNLLGLIARAGLTVERHGDRIRVRGPKAEVAQVSPAIAALKVELLELLPDLDAACSVCGLRDPCVSLTVAGATFCSKCWGDPVNAVDRRHGGRR